jgi:competence protein ComEC
MSTIIAECYLLDVGQGTAQVIHLRDGSAIVIDCGPSYLVLGDLLNRRLGIRRIEALILSHNHRDHVGGVPGLVGQFRKAIDRVYFLQDQVATDFQVSQTFTFLKREHDAGNVPEPIPLIRSPVNKLLYHGGRAEDQVTLELLFPNLFENVEAQASGKQNTTCGVLLLCCGGRRILFPGDLEIEGWRSINRQREGRPVECDVMAVPHHGGQIVRYKKANETYDELHDLIAGDLVWLYTQAIRSKTAVISVGTDNTYPDQHPLPPQVQSIRRSGACVMCTEITARCTSRLDQLGVAVRQPQSLPGKCSTSGASAGKQATSVGCAGTVLVKIGREEVTVVGQSEHQQSIDAVLSTPSHHPLCRNDAASTSSSGN